MIRARLPAVLLAILLLAAPALADRETATFFSERGEKALQEKDWAAAEGHFRRAIQEDENYLPAKYGLAQAQLGAGSFIIGLATLRGFVDLARATPPTDTEWKALVAKAEKQLKELDVSFGELEKIGDRYVADLIVLARKWSAKDPALAGKAVRRVLDLRPGHAEATALLAKLGVSKAARVVLFGGRDASEWNSFNPPRWSVADGNIVGEARDGTFVVRSLKDFKGDFDVRGELRMAEELGPDPAIGLAAGFNAIEEAYVATILNKKIQILDRSLTGTRRVRVVLPSDFQGTLNLDGWNVFELRFRSGEIATFVNGVEVSREPRPSSRSGGYVGLYIANAKCLFRGIEVQPR